MKQLRITAWALLLSLMLSLLPVTALAEEVPAAPEAPLTQEAMAQTIAETAMTYGGAASVQYALWQDGRIVYAGHAGVYSKSENRLLTDDTLYGVGSISKTYTAAAMMKLVEQGRVNLDAPVTRYLPDFKMADERYKQITVRMLLNHSSGLMGAAGGNSFLLGDGDYDATDDLLERLSTQTLQAAPGAYSVYSNDSYSLAQLVIEAASGMDYTAYLHKTITGPLGLKNTLTPADDFDQSRLAKGYLTPTEVRPLPPETLAIAGCGGIYATASDLASFGGALCGDKLLRKSSRDAMAADEFLRGMWPENSTDSAVAYGLGWDSVHMFPFSQNGIQALVKGGDTLAYHAGLVVIPEHNMAAAVLSSGGVSTYDQMAAAKMLINALAAKGVAITETADLDEAASAPMPQELTALSGWYGSSVQVGKIDITADGVLKLNLSGTEQTFTYRADGSFRDEGNTALLRLVEEDNGRVYLYQYGYGILEGLTGMVAAEYVLQRLPEAETDPAVLAAWQKREGKVYLALTERYTSVMYPASGVFAAVSLEGSPEGYMMSSRLIDEDTAVSDIQIPGTGSRDSGTASAMVIDGVEYLEINGTVYQDAASLPAASAAETSLCTIQPEGHARWYSIGSCAGQTMTVAVPENAGFCVYDANMLMTASSYAYGDTAVTLPEGGYIVYAGVPGARFEITMSPARQSAAET